MPISYFILNDAQGATQNLNAVIQEFSGFYCLGETDNLEEGMNSILKGIPDVIFINVDITPLKEYGNIFSYCKEIGNYIQKKPKYIALSKDTAMAYYALKNNFFDYLLIPGRELEIRKIILQLRKDLRHFLDDTLCLKSYKDYTLLPIDDILYLKADNNTTDFYMGTGQRISAFKTLKSFELVLPINFIRIHHSYIVNKTRICRINFGKSRCYLNYDDISLPFSKSYRNNLRKLEKYLEQKAISFV